MAPTTIHIALLLGLGLGFAFGTMFGVLAGRSGEVAFRKILVRREVARRLGLAADDADVPARRTAVTTVPPDLTDDDLAALAYFASRRSTGRPRGGIGGRR